MKILYIFLTSLTLSACAVHRSSSLNMLDKRSDYAQEKRIKEDLSLIQNPLLTPRRTQPQVTDIFIYPHEMPTGDYFRGGWIRTIISESKWAIEKKSDHKK